MRVLQWGWGHSPYLGLAPFLVALTVLGRGAQNIGQTTYPLVGRQLLGVGNGAIGTMTALGGLAGVAVAATVGARVTAANALRMLAIGQAMVLAAFVCLAVPAGGTPALWAGAVLVWAGGGLVFPAAMTAVGTSGTGNRSRAMAVFAVGLSVGLTGGPLLEAGVLHLLSESLRATFAALLPLPLAATLLSIIGAAVHGRSGSSGGRSEEATDAGVMALLVADGAAGELPPRAGGQAPRPKLRPGLLRLPAYRLALAVLLMYEAAFAALVAFGGLLATRADGATSSGAELGFAAFYTVSLLVRLLVVRLSPIRALRPILVASVIVTAGGVAVLGTVHHYDLFVVGMGLLGAPHGVTFPVASSIVAEHVDHLTLGRANARLMASTDSAAVVVPLAFGWLAAAAGYRTTFLVLELPVALLGTVLFIELAAPRWAHRGRHQGTTTPTEARTRDPESECVRRRSSG